MYTLNRDTIRSGPGRLGEGCSPCQVGGIEDTCPVHGTDHHWLAGSEQHESDRFESIVHIGDGLNPTATEGVPFRWSDVESERSQVQIRILGSKREWEQGRTGERPRLAHKLTAVEHAFLR